MGCILLYNVFLVSGVKFFNLLDKGVFFELFVRKFCIVEVFCNGDIVFIFKVICESVEGGFCMSILFFNIIIGFFEDIIIFYFVI